MVQLTVNFCPELGLYNGARGIIRDVVYPLNSFASPIPIPLASPLNIKIDKIFAYHSNFSLQSFFDSFQNKTTSHTLRLVLPSDTHTDDNALFDYEFIQYDFGSTYQELLYNNNHLLHPLSYESNRCFWLHLGMAANINPFFLGIASRHIARQIINQLGYVYNSDIEEVVELSRDIDSACLQYLFSNELSHFIIWIAQDFSENNPTRLHCISNLPDGAIVPENYSHIIIPQLRAHYTLLKYDDDAGMDSYWNNLFNYGSNIAKFTAINPGGNFSVADICDYLRVNHNELSFSDAALPPLPIPKNPATPPIPLQTRQNNNELMAVNEDNVDADLFGGYNPNVCPIIMVEFPGYMGPSLNQNMEDNGWSKVIPISSCQRRCEKLCCSRTGLPLVVSKAASLHSLQGLTAGPGLAIEKIIFSWNGKAEGLWPGAAYVGTSRVVDIGCLALKEGFHKNDLKEKIGTSLAWVQQDAELSRIRTEAFALREQLAADNIGNEQDYIALLNWLVDYVDKKSSEENRYEEIKSTFVFQLRRALNNLNIDVVQNA